MVKNMTLQFIECREVVHLWFVCMLRTRWTGAYPWSIAGVDLVPE